MYPLKGKRVLITGGTGSLGKVLVRRLLSGEMGQPAKIVVFSRDEAKQHDMRRGLHAPARRPPTRSSTTTSSELLEFLIGDVRDYHSVASALRDADVVFNAAALKQVPTCEYFPFEAVQTNIGGPENIVRAIHEHELPVETVVGISTDKACKPVNVMGMTKAIQERVFIQANMRCPNTRFICVRYGNVLASRGSVIPLFHEQIRSGGPVTITTDDMTRFLLSLDQAVDTVFAALCEAQARRDLHPARALAPAIDRHRREPHRRAADQDRWSPASARARRSHEILVSEEECHRTVDRGKYYAIQPMLPELRDGEPVRPSCSRASTARPTT